MNGSHLHIKNDVGGVDSHSLATNVMLLGLHPWYILIVVYVRKLWLDS
jgi:hypothetical protein